MRVRLGTTAASEGIRTAVCSGGTVDGEAANVMVCVAAFEGVKGASGGVPVVHPHNARPRMIRQ